MGIIWEVINVEVTSHGHTSGGIISPEYNSWYSMRQRCADPKNKHYHDYGGRGIRVWEKWNRFKNFLEDMGTKPSPKHSIERLNNDGDYEPSNCVWASPEEQARNKRVRNDSSTGIKGVSFERNKYRVRIFVEGKRIQIGMFQTIEEAVEARKKAELKYWVKSSL